MTKHINDKLSRIGVVEKKVRPFFYWQGDRQQEVFESNSKSLTLQFKMIIS